MVAGRELRVKAILHPQFATSHSQLATMPSFLVRIDDNTSEDKTLAVESAATVLTRRDQ
jgi:hypothetical protein